MKKQLESKFYEFNQNNSGGSFDVDENICHRVVIEAFNQEEAISKIKPMIENQSESCPCCGDRWSIYYPEEVNFSEFKEKGYPVEVYSHYEDAEDRWFSLYGEFPRLENPTWKKNIINSDVFQGKIYFNTLEQYYQFIANNYGQTIPDVRIHFLNGTKKEIFFKKKSKINEIQHQFQKRSRTA